MAKVELLPEKELVKTGPVDFADWNYQFLLGHIARRRFKLLVRLLQREAPRRLLEIGYGSGILMPELAKRCKELYGVDIHGEIEAVAEALGRSGVRASLYQGSVARLPFESEFFDCVVSVSVMEFVEEIEECCVEIARVLRREGCFLVVSPGKSWLVDCGLKLLSGRNGAGFGDRRQKLQAALKKYFDVVEARTFPKVTVRGGILYHSFKLRKKARV